MIFDITGVIAVVPPPSAENSLCHHSGDIGNKRVKQPMYGVKCYFQNTKKLLNQTKF